MEPRSVGKIASRFALLCVGVLSGCAVIGRPEDDPAVDVARQASFDAGVEALERGDHAAAADQLATVAAICPVDATGRRAVLLLAAAELDPRNPGGRANAAAELAAFHLGRSDRDSWEYTLASQLYTIALDYGANPIDPGAVPTARIIWGHYLNDDGTPLDAPLGVAADSLAAGAPASALAGDAPADGNTPEAGPAAGGPRCEVPSPHGDLVLPALTRTPVVARSAPAAATPASDTGAPPPSGDLRALQAEVDRLRSELASRDQELERIRRTLRP